jgi:hypothetical protein
MTILKLTNALVGCLLISTLPNFAQEQEFPASAGRVTFLISLTPTDSVYQLPHRFILAGSEHLLLDSVHSLSSPDDYRIDYSTGTISFSRVRLEAILSDSLPHGVVVKYRALPLTLRPEYSLHEQRPLSETTAAAGRAPLTSRPFSVDDLFSSKLQRSGTLVRGFTVGSNRDLSLTSGFRMQLSGDLAEDLRIVAALTDENIPIQPEGTTQSLREVDNVFVELQGPSYGATLGDFQHEVTGDRGGEFGRLSRKLQGATGTITFGAQRDASVGLTAGTQRGKFHTNQFRGREGSQGPFQLTGRNGERRILIIAGSERVFLNGQQMVRGEVNDYIIDYASGEVTFTSRRLITSASRLVVDFEYSDREFARNFIGGSGSGSLFDGLLSFNVSAMQEADDPDAPIEASLDDVARARLQESGSDRLRASLPGVRFVGVDTSTGIGLGQYAARDTVIGSNLRRVYLYAPGDSSALYNVTFSPVEDMPDDSAGYIRLGIGQFQFAGVGRGNYLPVVFLPMPQRHRLGTVRARANISQELTISTEYAMSEFDRNRLSTQDDADRTGAAYKASLKYSPRSIRVSGVNLGDLDLNLSDRRVQQKFAALDRFNEVEFDRKWNIETLPTVDERIREADMTYRPLPSLALSGGAGFLRHGNHLASDRVTAGIEYRDTVQRTLRYEVEDITMTSNALNERSDWTRQRANGEVLVLGIKPGIRIEAEDRSLATLDSDSMRQGGFRFLEVAPRLGSIQLMPVVASVEVQVRQEDSVSVGSYERAMHSLTQVYQADLHGIRDLSSSISLSVRKTEFTERFKARGNIDSDVVLVRSQSRYAPWQRAVEASVFYEFSNQRSARLERVFVRVPRGTGNYRYLGDLNNNSVADDNEFELTRFDGDYILVFAPSEQLVPVLDLKTSVRLRLEPARYFRQPANDVERVLAALSSETFLRMEEKSREEDAQRIYFLHTQRFLNDRATIAGAQSFTQDLYVFEHRADASLRLRYQQRKNLAQLVTATERSHALDRAVRLRTQLIPEVGNLTEYRNFIDRVWASARTPRERDLAGQSINTDFSYRPEPEWEAGFRVEFGRTIDRFRAPHAVADLNEQEFRASYSVLGIGQLRAEVRREEVVLSGGRHDPANPFPFEFTNGRVIGRSFLWQIAADYRVRQNIQLTFRYNGRREGPRPVVHLGHVEARAFF